MSDNLEVDQFIKQVESCVRLRGERLITDKEFADVVTADFRKMMEYQPRNDAERRAYREYGVAGVMLERQQ